MQVLRIALISFTLFGATSLSQARTIFPDIMSEFDVAQQACQKSENFKNDPSCIKRDHFWRVLRNNGYNFTIDQSNPNGYVWK